MTIQRQYPGRVEAPERTCDPGVAKHPAPYTDALLPIMAGLLPKGPALILDPFCGTGKVARLQSWLPNAIFYGYEIV